MPKIRLIHPTGVSGQHHPAGHELEIGSEVSPSDARYLVGIGKAAHIHDTPQPGETRHADPVPETREPAKGGKR
ncbi:MAG: hypothetical protein JSS67_03605 [Bacteroidetes bacterium]|nr:hypothetical protein [Bacteroidota bacterium]